MYMTIPCQKFRRTFILPTLTTYLLPIFMFIKKTVKMLLEANCFKYDIPNPKNIREHITQNRRHINNMSSNKIF